MASEVIPVRGNRLYGLRPFAATWFALILWVMGALSAEGVSAGQPWFSFAASPSPQAEADIRELLQNEDFRVRAWAEESLARLGSTAIDGHDSRDPGGEEPDLSDEPPMRQRIAEVFQELDSADFDTRARAAKSLIAWASSPTTAGTVMYAVNDYLKRGTASADLWRKLHELWPRLMDGWVHVQPEAGMLPPIDNQSIERLLDQLLTETAAPGLAEPSWESARRELLLVATRDDGVEPLRAAVESRLPDADLTPAGRDRLEEFAGLLKPALAAEIFVREAPHPYNVQMLWVDVPQRPAQAITATHFDQVDDHTAHLVTGTNLDEGDYPVGVLFPWVGKQGHFMLFHLNNLPTPRRRLAFMRTIQVGGAARLSALSGPSLESLLGDGRPLGVLQAHMLAFLDGAAVSKFAARHLCKYPDQPIAAENAPPPFDRQLGSTHDLLSFQLIYRGTVDAVDILVPWLEEESRRTEKIPLEATRAGPWLGMLAILARDKPTDGDVALARLLAIRDPLISNSAFPPDVGATAAALLLHRYGIGAATFGLVPVNNPGTPLIAHFENSTGNLLYRFEREEDRERVINWWGGRTRAKPDDR